MAVQLFETLAFSVLLMAWLTALGNTEKYFPEKDTYAHGNDDNASLPASKPNNSCVPAHPYPALPTTECYPYMYKGRGICSSILEDSLIYGSKQRQKDMEKNLYNFHVVEAYYLSKGDISDRCLETVQLAYCNHYFQRCDNTSSRIRPRSLCREACEVMVQQHCKTEFLRARVLNEAIKGDQAIHVTYKVGFDLMNCTKLPRRNGGTIPECYFPRELEGNRSREDLSDACYYGDGQSYHGNISVTRSGYTCQSWSSQCPHRHYRTPNDFPALKDAGNACRNPGSQAPHGPWCYTTNPSVRWEYCNITVCSPEDAYLSEWSPFSSCSASCGGGFKMRNRLCNGARFGGKNCSSLGALTEKIPCNDHNCSAPVDSSAETGLNRTLPQGLTITEIIIVSAGGSVLFFLVIVLVIMLGRTYRRRKPYVPDEEEITPYATVHISGVFAPNAEHERYDLPGMYENPLKTLPFLGRRASPKRQLRNDQNSPYENIDHLGRPFANPLQYLFFQPRYENESENGPFDVLIIKPGYDKLTPGTRRKRREHHAPFGRSLYGGVDKSGMPVYDSVIREIEMKCKGGQIVYYSDSESEENRHIDTILEVPSCDERSTLDKTTNENNFREMVSESEESDDAISLGDIVLGCTGIDMKTNRIQPPSFSSLKSDGKMLHVSRSRAALHMEDQTGLFGFYNSDLTKDAEA